MNLSFIIPYYKGKSFLPRLLNSIKYSYIASKKLINIELIIIIDSMEDEISDLESLINSVFEEKIENIHFIYIKNNENLGVDKSRDIGLKKASGDYFTCFDQDDFVTIDYFSILEKYENNVVDYFFLNGYLFSLLSKKKVPMYYYISSLNLKKIIYNNIVLSPSFLIINRKFALQYNLHYTLPFSGFKGSDDWYFLLQMLLTKLSFNVILIKEKMINYCIHESNYSHDVIKMVDGSVKILDSLSYKNKNIQTFFRRKKTALLFSKKLYRKSKWKVAIKHPLSMLIFLYLYCKDTNRMFRYFHKMIIRF